MSTLDQIEIFGLPPKIVWPARASAGGLHVPNNRSGASEATLPWPLPFPPPATSGRRTAPPIIDQIRKALLPALRWAISTLCRIHDRLDRSHGAIPPPGSSSGRTPGCQSLAEMLLGPQSRPEAPHPAPPSPGPGSSAEPNRRAAEGKEAA